MLILYKRYKAKQRLAVYQDIVDSLGGEEEAPVNTLVNRDIAKKEVEYYEAEWDIYWRFGIILVAIGCMWVLYHQFTIKHWSPS